MKCSSCDDDGDYLACCIDGRLYDVCDYEHCGGCCVSAGDCSCNCHVDEPAEYGILYLPEELPEVDVSQDVDDLLEALIDALKRPVEHGWHNIPKFVRKGEPSYMPPLRSAA